MNYTDILHAIAEALKDGDDGALIDTRERIHDLLITEDELAALDALIDAGLDSIGRESA